MNDQRFDEAWVSLQASMSAGYADRETALYLRKFGEQAEAGGDLARAIEMYGAAVKIFPGVGVKKRLQALQRKH